MEKHPMNRIFIDGRLGRAPEEVGSGDNKVVKFSIAQNHEYTNKRNEKVSKTHWFNVVCFGRLGAACAANLVSGQDVTVEGSLQENSWTDDAGNRRSRHEIRAQNVKFGLRPKGSEAPLLQLRLTRLRLLQLRLKKPARPQPETARTSTSSRRP